MTFKIVEKPFSIQKVLDLKPFVEQFLEESRMVLPIGTALIITAIPNDNLELIITIKEEYQEENPKMNYVH